MTLQEIRDKYLNYFKDKGHVIIPSASLMPENDPTTLFTGSGMQPMLPYLLGQEHPLGTRLVDSQKCIRTEDIEEVGDNRHTTFFEMLGNWSLGDYFKEEQIKWMFHFLIDELGIDPNKLYISVFRGQDDIGIPRDEEAVGYWQELFREKGIEAKAVDNAEENGMGDGRIFYYEAAKNWWSRAGVPENMPVGEPGGPDSEMFYDFGADFKVHENSEFADKPCHVNCDCGRYLEIGNNVFMAYLKTNDGFKPLDKKNIDFGGGLERMATALNNKPDIFLIDVFAPMRSILEKMSGKKYGEDENDLIAFRVVMDHLRSATFLINDGAIPDNKDQGYFTRRFIRRAIRFAHNLGIKENFCGTVSQTVINLYQQSYPDLEKNQAMILNEMCKEEERFRKTLETGLKIFNQICENKESGDTITAKESFDLYQSYGFPLEVTEELAEERGFKVDSDGFKIEFSKHQELSRLGSEDKFKGGLGGDTQIHRQYHTATHLLHQALRQVLGDHVQQRGSNITDQRLRFDFSHPEKMTDEQKSEVEKIINEQIAKDLPMSFTMMSVLDAKAQGAIGLFEDKYADTVKVYTVGDPTGEYFSKEICGGPHVESIGGLGHFRIKKEESSSAGVRRIKGILE